MVPLIQRIAKHSFFVFAIFTSFTFASSACLGAEVGSPNLIVTEKLSKSIAAPNLLVAVLLTQATLRYYDKYQQWPKDDRQLLDYIRQYAPKVDIDRISKLVIKQTRRGIELMVSLKPFPPYVLSHAYSEYYIDISNNGENVKIYPLAPSPK